MKKIGLVLILLIIISCKKETNNEKNIKDIEKESFLDLYFPDTVNINNIYEGEIIYKSDLDSITTKLFVEGDSLRMQTLYLKDNLSLIKDNYEHIISDIISDTFYPVNSKHKIIFKHKFNHLGVNYLEGVLKDEVYIKEPDTSELRIITKYNHITLPVFVTDDENIIDSYFKND